MWSCCTCGKIIDVSVKSTSGVKFTQCKWTRVIHAPWSRKQRWPVRSEGSPCRSRATSSRTAPTECRQSSCHQSCWPVRTRWRNQRCRKRPTCPTGWGCSRRGRPTASCWSCAHAAQSCARRPCFRLRPVVNIKAAWSLRGTPLRHRTQVPASPRGGARSEVLIYYLLNSYFNFRQVHFILN